MNGRKNDRELPWEGTGNSSEIEDDREVEIQDLLDEGYDLLDGFVQWLEERVGLDARTAQQDCFNAESLLDYLANDHRKAAADINEFELRWFLFSHYIRKAIADDETAERLPDSLQRFYGYLQAVHAVLVPGWVLETLDDRAFYLKRRSVFQNLDEASEAEWQEGFREWCVELEEDLDLRCLLLPREIGDGLHWEDSMGWREATLQEEANQLWQEERTRMSYDGLDCESMRGTLTSSYLIWLETPQERLDDKTPREVIWEERQGADAVEEE